MRTVRSESRGRAARTAGTRCPAAGAVRQHLGQRVACPVDNSDCTDATGWTARARLISSAVTWTGRCAAPCLPRPFQPSRPGLLERHLRSTRQLVEVHGQPVQPASAGWHRLDCRTCSGAPVPRGARGTAARVATWTVSPVRPTFVARTARRGIRQPAPGRPAPRWCKDRTRRPCRSASCRDRPLGGSLRWMSRYPWVSPCHRIASCPCSQGR